jgi:hypothetical protein
MVPPLGSKESKEKKRQTSIERFGTEHPSSNAEIKKKIKKTNIETYKDPILRKNVSVRIKNAYKNDTAGIIEKRKQTNFEKTGEYKTLTSTAINNAKNTLLDRYDVTNPFKVHEDTYKKAGESSKLYFENKENKNKSIDKQKETNIKKWGVDNVYQSEEIKEKSKQTKKERYGDE